MCEGCIWVFDVEFIHDDKNSRTPDCPSGGDYSINGEESFDFMLTLGFDPYFVPYYYYTYYSGFNNLGALLFFDGDYWYPKFTAQIDPATNILSFRSFYPIINQKSYDYNTYSYSYYTYYWYGSATIAQ